MCQAVTVEGMNIVLCRFQDIVGISPQKELEVRYYVLFSSSNFKDS